MTSYEFGKINSWQSFRLNATLKIITQQEQFFQWLRMFLLINESLHKEFDSVYQQMYYVSLNQLMKEGIPYVEKATRLLKSGENKHLKEWFETLQNSLYKIKETFPENEWEYIEYKRHNACHIFQNHYEQIQDNGNIKSHRNSKEITEIDKNFQSILLKYKFDTGFDKHVTTTLYPILNDLDEDLKHIHSKEQNL